MKGETLEDERVWLRGDLEKMAKERGAVVEEAEIDRYVNSFCALSREDWVAFDIILAISRFRFGDDRTPAEPKWPTLEAIMEQAEEVRQQRLRGMWADGSKRFLIQGGKPPEE